MAKLNIEDVSSEIDEVCFVDEDDEEFSLYADGTGLLEFKRDGECRIHFYKSDIDKMIALFQAAKDKLCN